MGIEIRHKFQSPVADVDDSSLIRPSNWNDTHKITLGQDKIIGRASPGTGDAEEIICTPAARALLAAVNAAAQRALLELKAGATLDVASAAQFLSATANLLLSPQGVWDAAPPVVVSYASPLVLNFSAGINFEVTLSGNLTLSNPQNAKAGQAGCIVIHTGGSNRTISYGSAWNAAGGPLDISTSNTTDYLFYWVKSASEIVYSIVADPA